MIRKVLPLLAVFGLAALSPQIAEAGSAARAQSNQRSSEPARMPPVVPGVVVLSAIGAAVIRKNRRW